jgi:hypothetical protein
MYYVALCDCGDRPQYLAVKGGTTTTLSKAKRYNEPHQIDIVVETLNLVNDNKWAGMAYTTPFIPKSTK